MKKAIAILLTLVLAMGLAVSAFAATEKAPLKEPQVPGAPRFMDFSPSAPAAGTQSLKFDLPAVKSITAVWDGKIDGLVGLWYGPEFNPENVAITISFEDGAPELLDHWYDSGYDWFWEIWYTYDDETGKVTFYYHDSELRQAYTDTLKWGDDFDYAAYNATLPQTVITVPANLREDYINSLTKNPLKLGETQQVPAQEYTVYAFMPETSGTYYFYSTNFRNCDPYAELYDAKFNYIDGNHDLFDWNFGIIADLQAGKTYYLIVGGYYDYTEVADKFDVGVSNDLRKLNSVWQWLKDYVLTGGIWLRRYVVRGNNLYVFSGVSTRENLNFNANAQDEIARWLANTSLF